MNELDLPIWMYALAVLGGGFAGAINTIAGSGSLITLPLFVLMGLPASAANATNRVGVTIQNIVSLSTLKRRGALDLSGSAPFAGATLLGAVAGALVAVNVDERFLNLTIGLVMLTMLVVLWRNPRQFIEEAAREPRLGPLPSFFVFFGIGFYGGFIQAGVGILLLTALVLGAGLAPVKSNGIKLAVTLLFTAVALAIFAWNGQVDWQLGAIVASGQALGAWLAARFLADSKSAGLWMRRVLIAVVSVSAAAFVYRAVAA